MSFQSILARKAVNKSAGVSRTYPQHRNRAAKKPVARTALPVIAPCVHGGTDADIIERCPSCNGGARHVRECEVHGRCTLEPVSPSVMDCARCRREGLGYAPENSPAVTRFDALNLFPGTPGLRFNTTFSPNGTGYLIAWRSAVTDSEIYVGRLDAKFRPTGEPTRLVLDHPACASGREDPRLFIHNDAVHVAFVGVEKGLHGLRTNVLYARLTDSLAVAEVFAPAYSGRNYWEKNWSFFSRDGQLYAIYSVAPHRILAIDGDRAELVYDTPIYGRWSSGELRGGASPVLHNGEWWHFVHSSVLKPRHGFASHRLYDMGLCTFEDKPPFRVTAIAENPIVTADEATRPFGMDKSVFFPCGAVRSGNEWVVSAGIHDRWTELHRIADARALSSLTRISPPADWSHDPHCVEDYGIWSAIVAYDEYRLKKLNLTGATVLDIGAHVGTFAYAARQRGAQHVHCYEPEPASFAHLTANTATMPGVAPFNAAVGEVIGTWFRGRGEVTDPPTMIDLDAAILRAAAGSPTGRIELLKIDCERGEWPAFANATRLDLVDRIIGEWHKGYWNGREWDSKDLVPLLSPHGFDVFFTPSDSFCGLFSAERRK